MNIEVAIVIDGETTKVNSDLQELLQNVVQSYIKQNFISGKKLSREPRILKEPSTRKYRIGPEETNKVIERAKTLSHLTKTEATRIIMKELDRSFGSIYAILYRRTDLPFIPYDRTYMKTTKQAPNEPNQ